MCIRYKWISDIRRYLQNIRFNIYNHEYSQIYPVSVRIQSVDTLNSRNFIIDKLFPPVTFVGTT